MDSKRSKGEYTLFIIGVAESEWIPRIYRDVSDARIVIWIPAAPDKRALGLAVAQSKSSYCSDAIIEDVSAHVDGLLPISAYRQNYDLHVQEGIPSDREMGKNSPFDVNGSPVLFCPSNDTHVKMFESIVQHLAKAIFLLFDHRKGENCQATLDALGLEYYEGGVETLSRLRPSVIVVGNDWYHQTHMLMNHARKLSIPTVCLQEGCLDFETNHRMQWCDLPFIQGPRMLKYLRQFAYIPTGNPRFDSIKEVALPENPVVMINSNFTYGVHEDLREKWVGGVVKACQTIGVEFFISQHPRDTGSFGDWPTRRSGPTEINAHIASASVIVTRFSTIIYESMLAGRNVVYFNPHEETMRLFNEDNTGGIFVARDSFALEGALTAATATRDARQQEAFDRFLTSHCGTVDGRASERCAAALSAISHDYSGHREMRGKPNTEGRGSPKPETPRFVPPTRHRPRSAKPQPAVSVIIPCYNSARYLSESIESVLNQTLPDFELLLVDDGSTDRSAAVMSAYPDHRIRRLYQENRGLSAARNLGLRHAEGRHVTFLDADDLFLPNKLELQVDFLTEHPEIGLVSGSVLRTDKDGNVLYESKVVPGEIKPDRQFIFAQFPVHAPLVRSAWVEQVGLFDESLSAAEDWDYFCRLACLGCNMYAIADFVCAYRFVPGSMSTAAVSQTNAMLRVVEKTFSNPWMALPFREKRDEASSYTHLKGAARIFDSVDAAKGWSHIEEARACSSLTKENFEKQVADTMVSWIVHAQAEPNAYMDRAEKNAPSEMPLDVRDLRQRVSSKLIESFGFTIENGEPASSAGSRLLAPAKFKSPKSISQYERFVRAKTQWREGDLEAAEEAFTELVGLKDIPSTLRHQAIMGICGCSGARGFEQPCIDAFTLPMNKGLIEHEALFDHLKNFAVYCLEKNLFGDAAALAKKALELVEVNSERCIPLLRILAICDLVAKRFNEAEAYCGQIADLSTKPETGVQAQFLMVEVYKAQNKPLELIDGLFLKAKELAAVNKTLSQSVHLELAYYYMNQKRFDACFGILEEAQALMSDRISKSVLLARAECLALMGSTSEAEEAFEELFQRNMVDGDLEARESSYSLFTDLGIRLVLHGTSTEIKSLCRLASSRLSDTSKRAFLRRISNLLQLNSRLKSKAPWASH